MERKQLRLGLIGYGDIGSGIGSGLREEGLSSIAAWDIASFDGKFSQLIQRRAGEANVELVRSPAELAAKSDFIITAVPGLDSVPAAKSIVAHLEPRHRYIDIASATPKVKIGVAEALKPSGAKVADGGIEGSALKDRYQIPILASGPAAEEFRDTFNPWNMKFTVVGPDIGTGSAIKILRSVIMKGIETLLIECGLASARYGLLETVFNSAISTIDGRTFGELLKSTITTDVIHAERRFHELEMSAEALEDVGIEPIMTRSTVRRLRQVMEMGLKEHFGGVTPKDYQTALKAIDERLPSREKVNA
jgi:3-hydroxyisobutyrate dehydrogenase-like beta-hydroxyacid dehydrogenase